MLMQKLLACRVGLSTAVLIVPYLIPTMLASAELPTLSTCSSTISSDDCLTAEIAGKKSRRVQLSLTAKRASVSIGPYKVDTETLNGTFLPPLLKLDPGEDFELRLINNLGTLPAPLKMVEAILNPKDPNNTSGDHVMPLTSNDINLHTHGLIVSPKNARREGYDTITEGNGDNIFVDVPPSKSFTYDIDLPSTLNYFGGQQVDHPEGLFWYHPHIHGLAQRQISAGMAGPIAIGSPESYLRRMSELGLPYKDDAFISSIEPHYIVLKDIIVSADRDPGELDGKPESEATWIGFKEASGSVAYPPEWAAGFLPTTCDEAPAGWCIPTATGDKALPRPIGFTKKLVWMFTTNGQLDPIIPVGRGHVALLRIVNESPTVTYDLRFGPYPDGGVPFYVIGLDGAMPGDVPVQTASTGMFRAKLALRQPAVRLAKRTSLLLLPASRADILVGGSEEAASLSLSTKHVSMGAGANDADEWPSARLAQLQFGGGNVMPADAAFAPQLRIPTEISNGVPIHHLPTSCSPAALENTAKKQQHRRIVFDSNNSWFFIGSSVVTKDENGNEVETDVIAPRTMPMMADEHSWKTVPHICVKQGQTELWEIVNRTNETHNFHIHQSKFKVVGLVDPNNKLAHNPIFNQGDATDTNIWHDTFPVPPALTNSGTPDVATPGRIFVAINFGAEQQVGRFVFHCHILEHEDKGMMAPIEVIAAGQ